MKTEEYQNKNNQKKWYKILKQKISVRDEDNNKEVLGVGWLASVRFGEDEGGVVVELVEWWLVWVKFAGETYEADGNIEVLGELEMTKGVERRLDADSE